MQSIVQAKAYDSEKDISHQNRSVKECKAKIFVGGLRNAISEEDLKERFGKFGKIQTVQIMVDKYSKKRRGFAFIIYETES